MRSESPWTSPVAVDGKEPPRGVFRVVSVSRETGLSEFPFALDSLQGGTVLEAIARVMAGCAIAIKGG